MLDSSCNHAKEYIAIAIVLSSTIDVYDNTYSFP